MSSHYFLKKKLSDKQQHLLLEKSLTGFTIVEMLVIVGVVALLSASLILYSRTGERQVLLFREQARIMTAIYRAKSLSIATFGQPDIPCGYGVHFDVSGKFLIFKDVAPDCDSSTHKYDPGQSGIVVESFNLAAPIIFSSLPLTDIVFVPPDPTVFIQNAGNPLEQATIVLKTIDNQGSVSITITDSGQINVE